MNLEKVINKKEIEKRISELAKEISDDYKDKDIEVICVLKGAVVFTVELCMKIKSNTRFNFIELSSYSGKKSSGKINIIKGLTVDIKDKDVLVIEDIIDTGTTIKFLREYLLEKNPKSLKICTLVNKKETSETISIDYIGFTIEDKYIVGHGFDINNNYRNLEDIYYVLD